MKQAHKHLRTDLLASFVLPPMPLLLARRLLLARQDDRPQIFGGRSPFLGTRHSEECLVPILAEEFDEVDKQMLHQTKWAGYDDLTWQSAASLRGTAAFTRYQKKKKNKK